MLNNKNKLVIVIVFVRYLTVYVYTHICWLVGLSSVLSHTYLFIKLHIRGIMYLYSWWRYRRQVMTMMMMMMMTATSSATVGRVKSSQTASCHVPASLTSSLLIEHVSVLINLSTLVSTANLVDCQTSSPPPVNVNNKIQFESNRTHRHACCCCNHDLDSIILNLVHELQT